MKDIIIIGRGLAGATLSFHMIQKGIQHRIIDKPSLSSSSKVAAGLINPIVLKRLKMVQGAEEFMPEVSSFYTKIEKLTETSFYKPSSLHHIFANTGEINLWEEKKDIPFHSQYLKDVLPNSSKDINAPYGLGLMEDIAWLDTESYLQAHARYCQKHNVIIEERSIEQTEITQLSNSGNTVILCNGHLLKDWSLFPEGIFTPTRGEVMTIETDHLPSDAILHSSIFSISLGANTFKVGATYHWDNLTDQTTEEGLQRLKEDLEKVYTAAYTVIEHQAGVRPNTKDRKPIMGQISNNLMVFNGMGSRAALMTPHLSSLFIDFLLEQTPLPSQYDVSRFLTK